MARSSHHSNVRLVTTLLLGALSVGALSSACAAGKSEAEAPIAETTEAPVSAAPEAAPTTDAPAAVEVPEVWSADLTKEQKAAFMKERVMPAMAAVFKAHDAEEFADFDCKTCHGPNWLAPKDYLPGLTFKDGKITSFEEDPEESQFMANHVLPEMVKVLGVQPMDPATGQGFGCNGCHTVTMQ